MFEFGTVHAYAPAAAGVLAIICVQLVPLFTEYSILTFVTLLLVHVIFWEEPTFQLSPPFGEVTVIVPLGTGVYFKTLPASPTAHPVVALTKLNDLSASVIPLVCADQFVPPFVVALISPPEPPTQMLLPLAAPQP